MGLTTSQIDAKLLKAELHSRMSKAMVGGLKFGARADVTQMTLRPRVLEIRLSRHTGDFGTSMLVRLYFTEPAHVGGLMLVLLVAAKSPGPIGLVEQNDHVAQADRRADDWSQRHR